MERDRARDRGIERVEGAYAYQYLQPIAVSVFPANVPAFDTGTVTITGTSFGFSAASYEATFNGGSAAPQWVSDSSI